jgi:hypothetical protein
MLTITVNFPTRRAPSPQIWTRDTSLDGTTNGRAGINSAANVNAGTNSATHLGGQRCGNHEDPGDSTKYRKLAKHRPLLAQYLFDSLHDWHLKVLLVAAIIGHLAHIFFEGLQIKDAVVAFGIVITAEPRGDEPILRKASHQLYHSVNCLEDYVSAGGDGGGSKSPETAAGE